jgi:hypothetical protein
VVFGKKDVFDPGFQAVVVALQDSFEVSPVAVGSILDAQAVDPDPIGHRGD